MVQRLVVIAFPIDLVVAVDLDWGIGKADGLPWPRLRGDLAHFRKLTSTTTRDDGRNAIVMGRRTWQSKEVGGKPLARRLNVVVSRSPLTVPDGVIATGSIEAAVEAAKAAGVERVFVVGGAQIYVVALASPRLRYVYLTRVAGHYHCDARIPDLDAAGLVRDATWDGETVGEEQGVSYRIERLVAS
jgi:dihydrofolate reductase